VNCVLGIFYILSFIQRLNNFELMVKWLLLKINSAMEKMNGIFISEPDCCALLTFYINS